jgi:acyl carrier protein
MEEFIKEFELQFEEVESGSLKPDTELESIEEWGSLQALVIIAMIDSKYKVKVTGTELQQTKTVADVYNLVQSKINS